MFHFIPPAMLERRSGLLVADNVINHREVLQKSSTAR